MVFSRIHTSDVPGRGMARRIGFLARKISSNVIFAKGESAAT